MNGFSEDTEDISQPLQDEGSNSGGDGGRWPLALEEFDIPKDLGTPASAPTGLVSGVPSADDVFNIDNMSDPDDDGTVQHKPSSLAGAAAACGAGAAADLGVTGGTTRGCLSAPSSLAAAGLLEDEGETTSNPFVARKNPPRSAAASRKLPPGEAREDSSPCESRSSCSSMLSGDDTDENSVHSSDGNAYDADGDICSVIGSVDGEMSMMSESSYELSTASDDSDDLDELSSGISLGTDYSFESTDGNQSVVSCQGSEYEVPTLDRPIGMMLAKADSDDTETNFVCSKVRQKYERDVDGKPCELFEVVFKDGKREEYSRESVSLYRDNYESHQGTRGCEEFFFKV